MVREKAGVRRSSGKTGNYFLDRLLHGGASPLWLTVMFTAPFVILLVSLLAAIGLMNEQTRQKYLELELLQSARAYYEQILNTRLWNAQHEGVYVEVTERTLPNPYLEHPERDIVTSSGKRFTLMNPAYMTREISELTLDRGLYTFRITSLDPVNPVNTPDRWEEKALRTFTSFGEERHAVKDVRGTDMFRYIAPLITEEQCLSCHEKNGHRVGDVQGALSVNIPMALHKENYAFLRKADITGLAVIGVFSLIAFTLIVWVFSRSLSRGIQRELEAQRLRAVLALAGAAAHELRQPMTIITNIEEVIKDKKEKGEDVSKEIDVVIKQSLRMDAIIARMLNITEYQTKAYTSGVEIFDLGIQKPED